MKLGAAVARTMRRAEGGGKNRGKSDDRGEVGAWSLERGARDCPAERVIGGVVGGEEAARRIYEHFENRSENGMGIFKNFRDNPCQLKETGSQRQARQGWSRISTGRRQLLQQRESKAARLCTWGRRRARNKRVCRVLETR